MVDDDGSGTTGTVINNAWKTQLYDQIDAALAAVGTAGGWPGGVAGNLPFPAIQVPSADPNVLDDYEEGTWLPALTGVSGGSGQTYSSQVGSYVKVGKLVHAVGTFRLATKGTFNGVVVMVGWPFAGGAAPTGGVLGITYYELAVPIYFMTGSVQGATGYLKVVKAAGAAYADLVAADLNENTALTFAATYMTP